MRLIEVLKEQPIIIRLKIEYLSGLYVPCIIGGVNTFLEIDTGAQVSTLSKSLLSRIRFERVGKQNVVAGSSDRVIRSSVYYGTITFTDGKRELQFTTHFHEGGELYSNKSVQGLIGLDLLQKMELNVSFLKQMATLTIHPE